MKKILLMLIIISVFLVAACAQQPATQNVVVTEPVSVQSAEPTVEAEPVVEPETQPASVVQAASKEVEMTNAGFSPKTLTISKGDTVTWTNKVSRKVWPASLVHPTHTVYPGSGIAKCGSDPDNIFDACSGLAQGESYSFTFNEEGSWGYHDHLAPGFKGTITVE